MKRPPEILFWFILALPISGQTGVAQDCNFNGVPDQTDLAEGTSADCNANGVPDECDHLPLRFMGGQPLAEAVGEMLAADFDGDGDIDLAQANEAAVSVWLNDGQGKFTARELFPLTQFEGQVVAGDFDGDGDIDLVAVHMDQRERFTRFTLALNDGRGAFTSGPTTRLPGFDIEFIPPVQPVRAVDVNGDGAVDLLIGDHCEDRFFLGQADGTFGRIGHLPVIGAAVSLASGDLDGDGDIDFAATENGSASACRILDSDVVSVFLNNGDGTFTRNEIVVASAGPIAAGDFDADGDLDLATSSRLFWNDGTGSFSRFQFKYVNLPEGEMVAGDVDGNGTVDLIGRSTVVLNLGAGEFTDPIRYPPDAAFVGDLDGDGDLDLVDGARVVLTEPVLPSMDCNANQIPDACELADGTSNDCDDNGVPDECDLGPAIQFRPGVDYAAGNCSRGIAVGDMDGSGLPDLVVPNWPENTVDILRNLGDGTFADPLGVPVDGPRMVIIEDFDGDRVPDFAATNANSANVSIGLNRGPAGFVVRSYGVRESPRHVVAGDLDGDGDLDLVTASPLSDTVSVLLNDGNGEFSRGGEIQFFDGNPTGVAVADIDNDGNLDIVVGGGHGGVVILQNDGNAGFVGQCCVGGSGKLRLFFFGPHPYVGAVGDVNRDGLPDIIVTSGGTETLHVLTNSGSNSREWMRQGFEIEPPLGQPALVDINRDGAPDILVPVRGRFVGDPGRILMLLNDGDGTFQGPVLVSGAEVAGTATLLVTADFDGDGDVDLAANPHCGVVSVLMNRHFDPVGPDCNGNGRLDVCDIAAGQAADENGNGAIDVCELRIPPVIIAPAENDFICDKLPYSRQLELLKGLQPIDWTLIETPSGVTIDTLSGRVAWNPVGPPGAHVIRARATNVIGGSDDVEWTLTVGRSLGNSIPAERPNALAVADLNQDGFEDAVVVSSGENGALFTLVGSETGGFCEGQRIPLDLDPTGIVVGDWNGDGHPDAAVTHWGSRVAGRFEPERSLITIFVGRDDGRLDVGPVYAWGFQNETLASGDFNEDGHADLVVASFGTDEVGVWLGRGDGSFAEPDVGYTTGEGPAGLRIVDLDGDEHLDIAVANLESGTVGILLGDGTGDFSVHQTFASGPGARWVVSLDYTHDGVPDLAVANSRQGTVCTFKGSGDGTFERDLCYPVGQGPRWIETGDFSGDEFLDLVVANHGSMSLSVFRGQASGTFCPAGVIDVGTGPDSLGVGDWDQNGLPDLLVGEKSGGSLRILTNLRLDEQDCPDCNRDGIDDVIAIFNSLDVDSNDNRVPDECEGPPTLLRIADGVGGLNPQTGVADTYISPLGENVALTKFGLLATEPLLLNVVFSFYTGSGTPPQVSGLLDLGEGVHTVLLDRPVEPGHWLKLQLSVRGKRSGEQRAFSIWVAHQPLDVNQDGISDIRDATEIAQEFLGRQHPLLADLQGDGVVNIQDITHFGVQWFGNAPAMRAWRNTRLPPKPE